MDAQSNMPDLDIGPAVAKLRFFRFAEYVLIFLTIIAIPVFAGVYDLRDNAAELEQKFGSGFSPGALNLALVALAAAIVTGILVYAAAGKLRASLLRRHRILLPVAGIAFLAVGVIFGMQAESMMHRATMIRISPAPSAFKTLGMQFNFHLSMQSEARRKEILAELDEQIRQENAEKQAKAAAIEKAAFPRIALAEFGIGAAVACALGLWGLLGFAGTKLGPALTPMTYLDAVEQTRRKQTPPRFGGRPIGRTRGLFYLLAAIALVAGQFLLPELPFGLGTLLGIVGGLVVFIALFRTKQYFQVSADSLLDKDKRPPILFLRSFSDDPKVNAAAGITHEGLAQLIDFSVETRLANHFMRFGPFIAVGSPQETVPQIGAARAKLSDDAWQQAVTDWMAQASVIVIYAGTTHWVGWELACIIEGGWTGKLIVLFPPVLPFPGLWQTPWLKRQKPDMLKRFEQTKAAFAGTKWAGAWAVAEPETIIAARFELDGGITFTRSLRRSKDAYDFSAKRVHLAILSALPVETAAQPGNSDTVPAT